MADRKNVIKRLRKVSYYFKSLLAVGWQGDADIYREHIESVNMAIAMLKEQPDVIRCNDCAEYHEWDGGKICMRLGSYYGDVPPDWFCAYGRKAMKCND